jgi:hypothetical protein
MNRIVWLVAMLGLAAVGCGNNECEDAIDKFEECGPLCQRDVRQLPLEI